MKSNIQITIHVSRIISVDKFIPHSPSPIPNHTNHKIQAQISPTPTTTPETRLTAAPLLVGASLATVVATEPVAVQILAPQAYPLGQQSPPAVSEQLNQPPGHLPVLLEEPEAVVTGITIVFPSEVNVVEEVVGQDVVSHSRFVWQQPPL